MQPWIRLCLLVYVVNAETYEGQLYEDLLYFYQSHVRPVKNETERVTVKFGASFIRLIDLDEKTQILTTNLWLEMRWNDPSLAWEPHRYGYITKLHIPTTQIWIPDIVLYNNAAGEPHVTIMNDAIIYYDGTIVWKPPSIYKSLCEIDIMWFPYDEQTCLMKFGGWTHDATVLDMVQLPEDVATVVEKIDENGKPYKVHFIERGMDLSYYYVNAGWDLLNLTSERREKIYADCCGISFYVDITFYFKFRRKPLFYTVNLVIPCMLLAVLTMLVFYLPASSGVKITFSVSILVTLSVLVLVLIDLIPPNSIVIPLMARYLLFTISLVSFSVIITVVTMNLHLRTGATHHMPGWVKIVFLKKLPHLLCIKPCADSDDEDEDAFKPHSPFLSAHSDPRWRDLPPGVVPGIKFAQYRRPSPNFSPSLSDLRSPIAQMPLEKLAPEDPQTPVCHPLIIQKMLRNVQLITQHYKAIAEEEKESMEWSYVAMIIDRLFLILFTVMNIVGTVVIVLQAPTISDTTLPLPVPRFPKGPLGGDTLNESLPFLAATAASAVDNIASHLET